MVGPTQPTLTDAPNSNVPGIHWPAVVGARDAAVLALLFQMESTQWLSAETLHEQQNQQLGALLDHARRHCAFYRERLPNDLTRWHDIPLLARADLQTQVDGIQATTYPRAHGKTFDIATGGSTAEPVTVRRTALTQLFWQAATLRDHLWHRRDLSATMAIIRQFPEPVDSTKPGRWGGVLRSGPACSCGRGLPTLRRVVGRTRNMAVSPQGKAFWPVLETQRMLEAIPHLRQYQFEQTAIDAITVLLVCTPAPTVEQLLRLQTVLEQALGHAYRWTWRFQEIPIPSGASGKFEEFVSLIAEPGVGASPISLSKSVMGLT